MAPKKKTAASKSSVESDRHLAPRITLRLPEPYGRLLRELAEKNERTMTAEVMIALRDRLKEHGLWPPAGGANDGD